MDYFDKIRSREYSRLDLLGQVYLDSTGAALFPSSLLRAHTQLLTDTVLGNTHSSNPTSHLSTLLEKQTRNDILNFFNASPSDYDLIFTANASAAIKLVAESFPFRYGSSLLLLQDNHNSVLGIREYARRGGAHVRYMHLDDELRAKDVEKHFRRRVRRRPSLFAYPAQSNFSGVKHPLKIVSEAEKKGWHVLLDVAAYAASNELDLSIIQPHFVPISFYKMFGYPTGLGALLVRRDARHLLLRPWLVGGTVKLPSVGKGNHIFSSDSAAFEDGTINFLGIPAVKLGLDFLKAVGMERISAQVKTLTAVLLNGLVSMRRKDGQRQVRVYGPEYTRMRGGTVTFDVMGNNGKRVDPRRVEQAANEQGISLRVGCFCNQGAGEKALGVYENVDKTCVRRDGDRINFDTLSKCTKVGFLGCVRVSVGFYNNIADIDLFLDSLDKFCAGLELHT